MIPAMSSSHFVFAGGGTGGHLYPGLAVADALRQRNADATITFFTTTRELDRRLVGRRDYAQVEQPVRPFTVHPLRVGGFLRAWSRSVRQARQVFERNPPKAVLGLGGYAAGPPVVAARKLGIRTALLNPDALPGRANRYLARHADRVISQWERSREYLPAGTECVAWGCPIRAQFADAQKQMGRERFRLDPTRPLLVVTGASQGARTVNRTMHHVWPEFAVRYPRWQLLHLTGPADEDETRRVYEAVGVEATVLAFTHQMWDALAAADLVVARAGASTLAELTALGLPAILLPYPYHRDRHQHANAALLVEAGAALLVEDQRDPAANCRPLLDALEQAADDATRADMAAAARSLAKPDAASRVAAWLAS